MEDQFITWGDLNCLSPSLKCSLQNIFCELNCNELLFKKEENGLILISDSKKTLVFREGGISQNLGQLLKYGTDGLPLLTCEELADCITNNLNLSDLVSEINPNLLHIDSTGKLKVNCSNTKIYTSPDNSISIEEKGGVIEYKLN